MAYCSTTPQAEVHLELLGAPVDDHFLNRVFLHRSEHTSLRSYPVYRDELARRLVVEEVIDAAHWLAYAAGMDESELEEAGKVSEAVIRTALLLHTLKRTEMPDWVAFEKLIAMLRKKFGVMATGKPRVGAEPGVIAIPKNLPTQFRVVVEALRQSVEDDLPKILAVSVSDVDHFDREASQFWQKATGGINDDDGSLLTPSSPQISIR